MKTAGLATQAPADELLEAWHLSEEQIDDHLVGELDGRVAAHLADCEHCADRVAEAAEPMASFRDVTIAWSERRSATMPIPAVETDASVWHRRAGWAMTACALVVGISFVNNGRKLESVRVSAQFTQTTSTASAGAVSVAASTKPSARDAETGDEGTDVVAARYSGDNRMLKAIDSELDAAVDTPAAMGLETVSDRDLSQGVPRSVQD